MNQTEKLLHSMLADLWVDLQDPSIFWQAGVLALCLSLAWWLSRGALRRLRRMRRDAQVAVDEAIAVAGGDAATARGDAAILAADAAAAGGAAGGQGASGASPAIASATVAGTTTVAVASGATAAGRGALSLLASEAAQQALARVLFPLYGLVLVSVARPILARWQATNLLKLAIALLIGMALARIVIHVVSRMTQSPALVAFERMVVAVVWAGMALYVSGLWVDVVELLESMSFHVGKQSITVWMLVTGAFWLLMTQLGALWLGAFLEGRLLASEALDPSLRAVFSRLLRAVLLLVGVLVGLSLVGLDITALSVFGGALGVGVGLGLQRIASNYISGFIVLIERMVRIGDVVKVDQFTGQVREISTRFTVLRAADGVEHIVPNEMLTSLPVQNFSRSGALRLKVSVQVAYGTDIDAAIRLAGEAAASVPRVLADPPPVVVLTQFASDGLTLDVTFVIADPHLGQGNVMSAVARAVWARFQDAGITVPFPQREIRIVGGADRIDGLPTGGLPVQTAGVASATTKVGS